MIKNFTLFFGLAILLSSCLKDLEDKSLVNVDSEFKITLSQSLTSSGSQFALDITTLFDQECSDNIILSSLTKSSQSVSLGIENIVEAGNCEGDNYTAYKKETLDLQNGSYNINISLRNTINSLGQLTQTETEYQLEMSDVNGIIVEKSIIKKIPSNLIWGTIGGNSMTNDYEAIIEKTESILGIESNVSVNLESGDYGFFVVDPDNNFNAFLDASLFSSGLSFVYPQGGSQSEIQQSIYELREIYPTITFNVMDSNGNIY